ncbi:hypothetical protein SAY86_008365 [Trapa natans]|uniref:Uncharacterized protein n=1 Tax=Trapa natans TaxID=22666 RepID=A0AAN7KA10_TRANT|nr:hypothetical protein SAY86_008365 [Trapa natans]
MFVREKGDAGGMFVREKGDAGGMFVREKGDAVDRQMLFFACLLLLVLFSAQAVAFLSFHKSFFPSLTPLVWSEPVDVETLVGKGPSNSINKTTQALSLLQIRVP